MTVEHLIEGLSVAYGIMLHTIGRQSTRHTTEQGQPMPQPPPQSTEDIEHLRAEITAGRLPLVWFTSAAVGVEEGRSGKIMGLTEPYEGDFIQVRPTGSMDVLSFSPAEVTLTRPPRKRKPEPTPSDKEVASEQPSTPVMAAPMIHSASVNPAPKEPSLNSTESETTNDDAQNTVQDAEPKTDSKGEPKRAGAKPAGRKQQPVAVTVTLTSTDEGDWTVEVIVGKKRIKPMPVTPASVGQAAKALHPEVSEAVDAVLEAARERHRARVEQLRAELEVAQQALDELTT